MAGFIKEISDSEFGQLMELGSKFGGTFGFVTGAISLFEESDTDKILGAINELREEMERNFKALGELIAQQTKIIVDTVNLNAMAEALAHTDTANYQIQRYLETGDEDALDFAENESILGIRFFANLGGHPDPYFLPGLLKAGTVRILVIAAEPPEFRSNEANIDQIEGMIANLSSMIDTIRSRVSASHTVTQQDHQRKCPVDIDIP